MSFLSGICIAHWSFAILKSKKITVRGDTMILGISKKLANIFAVGLLVCTSLKADVPQENPTQIVTRNAQFN